MTDYADIDAAAALQREQAQIAAAIAILDDDGTVSTVAIAPTALSEQPSAVPMTIATLEPPQSLLVGVRAGLIQRYNAINRELADLGVTGGPPNHAGAPGDRS